NTGCECEITDVNDVPDLKGIDSNCDGVDGILEGSGANVVFVSESKGENSNDGLSPATAKRSIQAGVDVAGEKGRSYVLIAGGSYGESVSLEGGISLYGGYSAGYGTRDVDVNQTSILAEDGAYYEDGNAYK